MHALTAGARVDQFEVIRQLGEGATAEVYLARDTELGRRVALKVVHPEWLGEGAAELFLQEARTTAKFNHPHIITIFGVGQHLGMPYVALEFLEGDNLRDRIVERRPGMQEAMRIGLAIAQALKEAHRHGVLHRDLKPENVLIAGDGRLRVVDFGLATQVALPAARGERESRPPSDKRKTESGMKGTPAYMAPEQWMELELASTADMWAFGVLLYELCTGALPFDGYSLREIARKVCGDGQPASLASLVPAAPRELAALVHACLSRDPDERPAAEEAELVLASLLTAAPERQRREGSPYRGLLPFDEKHADLFFGRDAEIDGLVERARHHPVLPIVGPSGAGKSSLVRAGFIPRLREQHAWVVLTVRPGSRPFQTVAARLIESQVDSHAPTIQRASDMTEVMTSTTQAPEPVESLAMRLRLAPHLLSMELRKLAAHRDANVLLFVDQLEELITLTGDSATQHAFIEAICSAAEDASDPVRVVFTIRDDFLGRLAVSDALRNALRHLTLVQVLNDDSLVDVLRQPLRLTAYQFEDDALPEDMAAEVAGERAGLPLLQFAAQLMWERRDSERKLLTREAYRAMSGVAGALAEHADGILDSFSARERALARDLLLRMVTPDRTRTIISEDAALEGLGEGGSTVLERMKASRLVAVQKARADTGVEVLLELAHESLVHSWDTLRRWLEESADEHVFLAEVGEAARLWDKRGRRPEELWQGAALTDALRSLQRCSSTVPELTRAFLQAGRQRQRRRVQQRRAIFVAIVVVLSAVTLVFAWQKREADQQRQDAVEQRERAEQQTAAATREGARAAYEQGAMLEARAKLRSGLELSKGALPVAARALWWRLRSEPLLWSRDIGAVGYEAAFTRDGHSVLVACQDGTVVVFDTRTGERSSLRGAPDQVVSVSLSPDDAIVAGGSFDAIMLWDRQSGRVVNELKGHRGAVRAVQFIGHDKLVSAGTEGTVLLWDLKSGKRKAVVGKAEGQVVRASISRDGRWVAGARRGEPLVYVWDTQKPGSPVDELHVEAMPRQVAISDDGKHVATAARDSSVSLWTVGSAAKRSISTGNSSALSLRFSPTGKWLSAGLDNGRLLVIDLDSGKLAHQLQAHQGEVFDASFSHDGRYIFTSSFDRSARLWEVGAQEPIEHLPAHDQAVYGLSFDAETKRLVSSSVDGTVVMWDLAAGRVRWRVQAPGSTPRGTQLSPDGKLIAAAGNDGLVHLWNTRGGESRGVLAGRSGSIEWLDFYDGGNKLATANWDGFVRLWDVQSRAQIGKMGVANEHLLSVSVDADERLVSSSRDGTVRVYDLRSQRQLHELPRRNIPIHLAQFAPDGALIVGDYGGSLRQWPLPRLEPRTLAEVGTRMHWGDMSPDGSLVALSLADTTVQLVRRSDGSKLRLAGHSREVNVATFSSDGKLVASAGDDASVRVWSSTTGRPTWHAPLLLSDPPLLYTHRGWQRLDGANDKPASRSWRKRVASEARYAVAVPSSDQLCLLTFDGTIELWDRQRDQQLTHKTLEAPSLPVATASGCYVQAKGALWRIHAGGAEHITSVEDVGAIAAHDTGLLVASGDQLLQLDAANAVASKRRVGGGVATASLRGGQAADEAGELAIGYSNGSVDIAFAGDGDRVVSLRRTPSSAPVRIAAGPRGTWIVGFADGTLGLWSSESGLPLRRARLNGPAIHIALTGGALHAASALGDHLSWNLAPFYSDDCALMREVWQRVPVVWQAPRAVRREAPTDHHCSPR